MKLLIPWIGIGDELLVLEVCGTPQAAPEDLGPGASRFESVSWLPGAVSHSVMRDRCRFTLRPARTADRGRPERRTVQPRALWDQMLSDGTVPSREELARLVGVSRARVTQVLGSQ